MQVNVIPSGNIHSFDYILFPEQHPASRNYIYEQFNNISQAMTNIGKEFLEESKHIYQQINDSNVIRVAKSALRSAKNLFSHNTIGFIDTLEAMQNAQPMMQRYIMAEPTIRDLYQQQLCNGYSDSYVDTFPNTIKENHYDYRKVMTGMIQDMVTEDGTDTWCSSNYYDELIPDDKPLDVMERFDIINTWTLMKMFIDNGDDPTDVYGSKLSK